MVLGTAWLIFAMPAVAQQESIPRYVGRNVCLECHSTVGGDGLCTLETIPGHHLSYEALSKPAAEHIAALCGVPRPHRQSRICLGCHTTGADAGRRWMNSTFDITDGVQCEACHGAGSIHVDTYCSPTYGTSFDQDRSIKPGDRADCVVCHFDRPSHQAVLTEGYRVPPANRRYKTPVNLAVSPDGKQLYVACESSNQLIVVDLDKREVLAEISVGQRPQDVAVSLDGRLIYVTNRLGNDLTVIDSVSRKVETTGSVGGDPHGVIPDGRGRLFVLNTADDAVSLLDAASLTEQKRLATGRGPWSLAISPDGSTIWVTNVRPQPTRFREPPDSEVTRIDVTRGMVTSRFVIADANMLQGIAFVPGRDVALITLMRTKSLVPITRLAQGWTITNGLGVLWPNGRVDQVLLDAPNDYFPDPDDIAVSPNGRFALVTSGGSDQVAVVDVDKLLSTITAASDQEREAVLPNHLGVSARFVVKRIAVGINPRGITFSPDGNFAYVANALDDSVTVIETDDFTVVGKIALGGPDEVTEIRWGQRLFHSANQTFGRQFSCRSCHPDGHINGLTHDIEADGLGVIPVDNRTLRGIFDTPPFKWEGTNPSLERQCGPRLAVFFTRLHPYTPSQLAALVRYMCTIERPRNHHRSADGLNLEQRRGKMVFERTTTNEGDALPPDKRCSSCHYGSYMTSRKSSFVASLMWFDEPVESAVVDLFDVASFGELGNAYMYDLAERKKFDVPHLNNIYGSPPYLHNGTARTLEEIFTRFNLFGWHGYTKDLTRRQFNDLMAYLGSL